MMSQKESISSHNGWKKRVKVTKNDREKAGKQTN